MGFALRDPETRAERLSLIDRPHVAPLNGLVRQMREATGAGCLIPWFDPRDAGTGARVLFLFAAPGHGAVESGFVSRDNPDSSATSMRLLCEEAGLDRAHTLLWNVVPWHVGTPKTKRTRRAGAQDLRDGVPWLIEVLSLCPALLAVVPFGRKAHRGWDLARSRIANGVPPPMARFPTWHTSPASLGAHSKRRDEVIETLSAVRRALA